MEYVVMTSGVWIKPMSSSATVVVLQVEHKRSCMSRALNWAHFVMRLINKDGFRTFLCQYSNFMCTYIHIQYTIHV